MQCHASGATFASERRVRGGNIHSYAYTCTSRHYPANKGPGLIAPQRHGGWVEVEPCAAVPRGCFVPRSRWACAGASDAPGGRDAVVLARRGTADFVYWPACGL